MAKKNRQATRMTPGFTGPFKGEPQQGTLFDKRAVDQLPGNVEGSRNRIGPRGYSLARSQQFQRALGLDNRFGTVGDPDTVRHTVPYREAQTGEHSEAIQGGASGRGTVPAVQPEEHPFGPVDLGPKHNGPMEQEEMDRVEAKDPRAFNYGEQMTRALRRGKSKMVDTLARSTMPVEDLKNLSAINIKPRDPGYAGTYSRNLRQVNLNTTFDSPTEQYPPERVKNPKQRANVDPDHEVTLLHELGHHVSAERDTWHSQYAMFSQRSAEEGFADNYAMAHWRRDPRHQGWTGGFDPREHTYRARHNPLGAGPYYMDTFGKENELPHKPGALGAVSESVQRPMLGHGTGVWDATMSEDKVRGEQPGEVGEGMQGATMPETAMYRKAARRSNQARWGVGQRPMTPPRWQVPRRNLGRQF